MNLNELYNIALDALTEKKSNGFGFNVGDNSTITVLSTLDNDVFKASNGSTIKDGQLTSTCSEYEAVNALMKADKSRIDNLVTLDIETGAFVTPCNDCLELILHIDPENADCNIMVDDHESVKLSTLLHNDSNDTVTTPTTDTPPIDSTQNTPSLDNFDDWLDGWEDTPSTAPAETAPATPPQGSLPFEDNPIPNRPDTSTKKNTSSYYQSKYLNATPNSMNGSVVPVNGGTSTFKSKRQNSDITSKMRANGLSEGDKKDFNKQRLYNAFTVENVVNLNGVQSSTASMEVAERQTLSKKELIKLAKEKKKMAKKDAKILEASSKKGSVA